MHIEIYSKHDFLLIFTELWAHTLQFHSGKSVSPCSRLGIEVDEAQPTIDKCT